MHHGPGDLVSVILIQITLMKQTRGKATVTAIDKLFLFFNIFRDNNNNNNNNIAAQLVYRHAA